MASVNEHNGPLKTANVAMFAGLEQCLSQLCQGLDACLKDPDKKYSDKVYAVVGAWTRLASFTDTQGGPSQTFDLDKAIQTLYSYTVRLVLLGEWPKLAPALKTHLSVTLKKATSVLNNRGNTTSAELCIRLITLVEDPWGNDVLSRVLTGHESISPQEGLRLCQNETPTLLALRLELLCESKCEDLALRLITVVRQCLTTNPAWVEGYTPTLKQDWADLHLALYFRFKKRSEIIQELQGWNLEECHALVQRLWRRGQATNPIHTYAGIRVWRCCCRLAEFCSQYTLATALVRLPPPPCLAELARQWLLIQKTGPAGEVSTGSVAEEQRNRTVVMVKKLMQHAETSSHMYTVAEVIHEEYGESMTALCIELYVRAMALDMNELEQRKLRQQTASQNSSTCQSQPNNLTPDSTDEGTSLASCPVRNTEALLSDRFMGLSRLVASQTSVCRECVLTAFSLKPTQERFLRLIELSPKKPRPSQSADKEKQGPRLEHCPSTESEPGDAPVTRDNTISGLVLAPPGSGGGPGVDPSFLVPSNVILGDDGKCVERDPVSSSIVPPPPPTCLEVDHNDVDSGIDMSDGGGTNESNSDLVTSNSEVASAFNQETADALGVSKPMMDDLAVVLHSPRWELLSWSVPWPELRALCERYLSDPESMKRVTTELKYLNIDYSQFKDWPKAVTRYGGIEKGYERWVEEDMPEDVEPHGNVQVLEPPAAPVKSIDKEDLPSKLVAMVGGEEVELVVSSSTKLRRRKKKVFLTDSSESEEEECRPRSKGFTAAMRRWNATHYAKPKSFDVSDSDAPSSALTEANNRNFPRKKGLPCAEKRGSPPVGASPELVLEVPVPPDASTYLLPKPMHKSVLYPNLTLGKTLYERTLHTSTAQKAPHFRKPSLSTQIASRLNPMLSGLLTRPPRPTTLYNTPFKPAALDLRKASLPRHCVLNDKVDTFPAPSLSRTIANLKGLDMLPVRQSTTAVHMVQIPVSNNNSTNPTPTNSSAVANRTNLVTESRESPLPAQPDHERPGPESVNPPTSDTSSNESNVGAVIVNNNSLADSRSVPPTSTTYASTPAVSIFQVAHRPLHSLVAGDGVVQPVMAVVGVPTTTVTNPRTKSGRGRGQQAHPATRGLPNTNNSEWSARLPAPVESFADSSSGETLASLLNRPTASVLQNDQHLNGPSMVVNNRPVRPTSRGSRSNNAAEGSGNARLMAHRVSSTTGTVPRSEDINGGSSNSSSNSMEAESVPCRVPLVKYVDLDMVSSPSRQRAMAAVAHRRPSQGSNSGSPDPQRSGVGKRPPSSSGAANPRSPALQPPLSPAIPSPQSPALSNPHSPSHGPRKPPSFRSNAVDRQSPQSSPYSRPSSRSQEAHSPSDAFALYGSRSFGDSFGSSLNADNSAIRSGYSNSVIIAPPPALPKFQQAFGRKTHYDCIASSSTSTDLSTNNRQSQPLPSMSTILPNRNVFPMPNREPGNVELQNAGMLLNSAQEAEANIEEEGLGSKLHSLLESALNGQISRSPTRSHLQMVPNVIRVVPTPSNSLSGPESQPHPSAPATVTKPPLPSPLFNALSNDSAHGLHSDASLSQDSMDSQNSSNPLSMLLSGPLDPLVSSSTLEQLREFESIFERVATTSQLKEQGQWNEADMESQMYMPPVSIDYLAPSTEFNTSSRPPNMVDATVDDARAEPNKPEVAEEEVTIVPPTESEPPLMQLLNVACAARQALQEETQTDSVETGPETMSDEVVQVKDEPESPPTSIVAASARVVVLPTVSTTTIPTPSVLVKAEPPVASTIDAVSSTPTTETTPTPPKARPKMPGKNNGASSSASTPSNLPTPIPSTSGNGSGSGGKSSGSSSPTKVVVAPPKSTQKPQDDESTVLRVQAILEEYREQLRNSPDLQNKPAPRRRSNPLPSPTQTPKRRKPSQSKVKLLSQHARAGGSNEAAGSSADTSATTSESPTAAPETRPAEKASPEAKPVAEAVAKQETLTSLTTLVSQSAPVSLPFTTVQPVLVTSQSGVRQVLLPVSLTAPGFRQALAAGKTSRIFSVRQVTVGGTQGYISLPARFSTPITVKTVATPSQAVVTTVSATLVHQAIPKAIVSSLSSDEKPTVCSGPSPGLSTTDTRLTIQALLGSQVADLLQVTPRSTTTTTVHWTNSSGVPSIGGVPIQPASQQQQQVSPPTSATLSFNMKLEKECEQKETRSNADLRFVPTVNRVNLPVPATSGIDPTILHATSQQVQELEQNRPPPSDLTLSLATTPSSTEANSDWTRSEAEKHNEEESMKLVEPGTSELLPCADLLSPGMSPQNCFALSDSPLPSPTPSPAASVEDDTSSSMGNHRPRVNEKNRWVMGRNEHGLMEPISRPSSAKRPTSQLALSPAVSNDLPDPFSMSCSPVNSFSSQAISQRTEFRSESSASQSEELTGAHVQLNKMIFAGQQSQQMEICHEQPRRIEEFPAMVKQDYRDSVPAPEFELKGDMNRHSDSPEASTSTEMGYFDAESKINDVELSAKKRRSDTLDKTPPQSVGEERVTRSRAARHSNASRESPVVDIRASSSASDSEMDSPKQDSDEDFDDPDSADSGRIVVPRRCMRLQKEESTDRGSRSDSSESFKSSPSDGAGKPPLTTPPPRSRRSSKRGHMRKNCPCCSSGTGTGPPGAHSPERKRTRSESMVTSPGPAVPLPKKVPEAAKSKTHKKNGRKK